MILSRHLSTLFKSTRPTTPHTHVCVSGASQSSMTECRRLLQLRHALIFFPVSREMIITVVSRDGTIWTAGPSPLRAASGPFDGTVSYPPILKVSSCWLFGGWVACSRPSQQHFFFLLLLCPISHHHPSYDTYMINMYMYSSERACSRVHQIVQLARERGLTYWTPFLAPTWKEAFTSVPHRRGGSRTGIPFPRDPPCLHLTQRLKGKSTT